MEIVKEIEKVLESDTSKSVKIAELCIIAEQYRIEGINILLEKTNGKQ